MLPPSSLTIRPRWRPVLHNTVRGQLALAMVALAAVLFSGSGRAAPLPAAESNASPNRFVPSVYRDFKDWKAACDALPLNRTLKLSLPSHDLLPLKTFAPFAEVLDAFFNLCRTSGLEQASAWLGPGPRQPEFFNTDAAYFLRPALPFQPFVERELIPPGTQLLMHGDLHGDVHSLVNWIDWLNRNRYLDEFRIVRPDVRLVFLGDYTDRGLYGIEVLYTMLRLKLENPDQVLIVRGNHEDVSLTARYGFIAEGRGKYGPAFDAKRVMRLYDFLPVVLYLGCGTNAVQCNHGGMEPGFSPRTLLDAPEGVRFQLLGSLNQKEFLQSHPDFEKSLSSAERRLMESELLDFQPQSPTVPAVIGFMWNDYSVVRGEPEFDFDPGRAFIYGEGPTHYLLEEGSGKTRHLQAVFRAHQQATIFNAMMRRLKVGRGIYRHWQSTDSVQFSNADLGVVAQKIELGRERRIPTGSVWTFNVVPDSVYGEALDYWFDTFGIVSTAADFADWRMRVVNQVLRPPQ